MKQGAYQILSIGSIYFCCLLVTYPLQAQIVPDTTLPINSTVISADKINIIDNGTRVGNNLFHSFVEFSVPTNNTAYFNNSGSIQNIIARVTGSSTSNIDGLIQANGTANLFLLNPNGIIFGAGARLNIGGSFLASTASNLNFEDGTQFSTTNHQNTPLLTISVPVGLQYGVKVGNIQVQGSTLQVSTGNTLALVGGDVRLQGGILQAPGGRVELGGIAGEATIGLNLNGNNLRLSFLDGLARANVSVNNGSSINVMTGFPLIGSFTNLSTIDIGNSGTIAINARNLDILSGSNLNGGISDVSVVTLALIARTKGIDLNTLTDDIDAINRIRQFFDRITGTEFRALFAGVGGLGPDGIQAGDITLNATGSLRIEQSSITSTVGIYGPGHGSNIKIQAGNVTLTDGTQLLTSSEGYGNAGSISVQGNEFIFISNSEIVSNVGAIQRAGVGDTGDITLQAQSLVLRDGAKLDLSNSGRGNVRNINMDILKNVDLSNSGISIKIDSFDAANSTGNININAGSLSLTNGASLSTFVGDPLQNNNELLSEVSGSGNININVRDTIFLASSRIFNTFFGGTNLINAISINTRSLTLTDSAMLTTNILAGLVSAAGNVEINATDAVSISGFSGISTSVGRGRGGNITINTRDFHLLDNAFLNAQTEARSPRGPGGNITVRANSFEAINGGQVLTNTSGEGQAGNIIFNISERLTLEGSTSGFFANTAPNSTGAGGSIIIDNPNQVIMRDGASIAVDSDGQGNAGSIQIQADSVRLDRRSFLSARTVSGDRGNITLNAQDVQLRRNSNITTNATGTATGGNIMINTDVLTALENSDITARAVGNFGGQVTISAQGIFGTQAKERLTPNSDITASSDLGPQFDGVVDLQIPDVTPASGLVNLQPPINPPEIARVCQPGATQPAGEFINTGRGGKPPSPIEPLSSNAGWVDSRFLRGSRSEVIGSTEIESPKTEIVEATGWIINAKGQVELVAEAPIATPYSPWYAPSGCNQQSNAR